MIAADKAKTSNNEVFDNVLTFGRAKNSFNSFLFSPIKDSVSIWRVTDDCVECALGRQSAWAKEHIREIDIPMKKGMVPSSFIGFLQNLAISGSESFFPQVTRSLINKLSTLGNQLPAPSEPEMLGSKAVEQSSVTLNLVENALVSLS